MYGAALAQPLDKIGGVRLAHELGTEDDELNLSGQRATDLRVHDVGHGQILRLRRDRLDGDGMHRHSVELAFQRVDNSGGEGGVAIDETSLGLLGLAGGGGKESVGSGNGVTGSRESGRRNGLVASIPVGFDGGNRSLGFGQLSLAARLGSTGFGEVLPSLFGLLGDLLSADGWTPSSRWARQDVPGRGVG